MRAVYVAPMRALNIVLAVLVREFTEALAVGRWVWHDKGEPQSVIRELLKQLSSDTAPQIKESWGEIVLGQQQARCLKRCSNRV